MEYIAALMGLVLHLAVACAQQPPVNAALRQNGATCRSNIAQVLHSCVGAIDGWSQTSSTTFKWDFFEDPINKWIEIRFSQRFLLTSWRIMEGYWGNEKNLRNVQLSFSDSSRQDFMLESREDGYIWEQFRLSAVKTGFMRMTILSTHGARYTVVAEIEIFGRKVLELPTTYYPVITRTPSLGTTSTPPQDCASRQLDYSNRESFKIQIIKPDFLSLFGQNLAPDMLAGSNSSLLLIATEFMANIIVVSKIDRPKEIRVNQLCMDTESAERVALTFFDSNGNNVGYYEGQVHEYCVWTGQVDNVAFINISLNTTPWSKISKLTIDVCYNI